MSAGYVDPLSTGHDHYLRLQGASLVATDALLATKDNLTAVIEERGMMCLHGEAGVGKTLSVNASLRGIAAQETVRVQFRSHPYPRDIRGVLFTALEIPGEPPVRALEYDLLLKRTLSQRLRVLVCDEAQWLSRECFELWRHLWDDDHTKIAIVFVGGGNCYRVLRREPMLASRIFIWQEMPRLTRDEVLQVIPSYHPIWENAAPDDIVLADTHAAHGNFRAWAKITVHAKRALDRLGRTTVDREVLSWTFSKLGGS